MSEAFIEDLHADWEQHGAEVIKTVREENPVAYLKITASIVPKEFNVSGFDELRSLNSEQLLGRIRDEIRRRLEGEGLKGKTLEAAVDRFTSVLLSEDDPALGGPDRLH